MKETSTPTNPGAVDLEFVDCECPYCHASLSFVGMQAGTVQQCPQCSESVIVPAHGETRGERLPIPVTTPRLRLRPFRDGDDHELVELTSDEDSFAYLHWLPHGEEDVREWLGREKLVRLGQPGRVLSLGVELTDGARLMGIVTLHFTDFENRQAGFSLMIDQAFRRKGYALETVRAMLGFCFKGIRLHRVVASNDSRNEAAVALLEKAGMRREGEFIKDQLVKSDWTTTVWHAMLDEEFEEG
jgi:RimJ/RimL family protein N-acetyltransferase